ncbi:interferon-inducible double-stranded RNA-dependent protein kinase activator A-like [Atheta coriaria]|uniref:interferon-inducible double-stranded RNA-dependent protein kinase activator A-like n=1 Tax=Dalotia coriaria TaxID=877792 RepID=UPI0031F479A0
MDIMDLIKSCKENLLKLMAESRTKQPISLLQEALVTLRLEAKYELVETTGADHSRSFKYRAFINDDISALGTANSKKGAKSASAQNLINYLLANDTSNASTESTPPLNNFSSPALEAGVTPPPAVENSIGMLQELCIIRGWGTPVYHEESRSGMSHIPIFTTSCIVSEHKTIGTAGNKKAAKKLAAQEMLAKLSNSAAPSAQLSSETCLVAIKQEPAPEPDDNIPKTNEISSLCKTEDVQDTAIASTSNNAAPDPDVVFTQIQQCVEESSGPDMLKLKIIGINKNANHMQTLCDVCQEQAFDMAITLSEDLDSEGMKQCMVQLRMPVLNTFTYIVCCGSGADDEKAKQNAARTTLEYLRMMALCTKVNFVHL